MEIKVLMVFLEDNRGIGASFHGHIFSGLGSSSPAVIKHRSATRAPTANMPGFIFAS
jgi:hypothetical protein